MRYQHVFELYVEMAEACLVGSMHALSKLVQQGLEKFFVSKRPFILYDFEKVAPTKLS